MRGPRKWVLSLCYFVPIIWFMYVSVELLAERSSSLTAMELAYQLHQQQNHRQPHNPHQSGRVGVGVGAEVGGEAPRLDENNMLPLPAETDEARRREVLQNFFAGVLSERENPNRAGAAGAGGAPEDPVARLLNNPQQEDPEVVAAAVRDPKFQDKLKRYLEHRRQGPLKDLQGGGRGDHMEGDQLGGGVGGGGVGGVGEEDPTVRYPSYVEAWGPNMPGEGGKPLVINASTLSPEEKRRYDEGWSHNSFNQYASDLISVHRSLPHNNPPECVEQRKEYSAQLPAVSVIIIFHNEAWSVLLRSVHSVLSRTPAHLLRQIILVDDLSSMEHLKRPLEVYWKREPKVQIVRAPKRVGLTQARLLGYQAATAEVLVFLDSHIECFPGWLEPLVDRILRSPGSTTVFPMTETIMDTTLATQETKYVNTRGIFRWRDINFRWEFLPFYERKRRKGLADPIRFVFGARNSWLEPMAERIQQAPQVTVFPSVEVIYADTMAVRENPEVDCRGIYRWKDLTFQWEGLPAPERERRRSRAEPIRSPTMPGGLFAISRQFFERLGTYDPGLEYWGGENIELSFKAWMCNGSVELIPCSHVGHIFRKSNPIKWQGNIGNKNSVRVAEVWMDDYKNYFYERINYNLGDFGDVTERKLLRQRLGCHNFDWYMKNVFPNMAIPRNMKFAGKVRNIASSQCLDSVGATSQPPQMFPCHNRGGNQFWYFTTEGDLYQDGNHLCESGGGLTQMGVCMSGLWTYTEARTLQHTKVGKCLAVSSGSTVVNLQDCSDSAWQKWTMTPRPGDRVFP